ncbi:MAG: heavy metal translocating P-type ATPase [Melioribacteraceae bacterium]
MTKNISIIITEKIINIETTKYNLPVTGMTCASCVARVEKILNKVEGIENVKVNYATEKVSFDVVDNNIDIKKTAEKLEKYGYSMQLQDSSFNKPTATSDSEDFGVFSKEYDELKKDFRLALIFTIPLFIISMLSNMYSSWSLSSDYTYKILLLLTTPVLFIPGKRFFKIFWTNLKHFSFEMNSLVAIGTGSAYAYSTVATLFPNLVSTSNNIAPHVYFDTAAVIITLILMGKVLEAKAKKKTNTAIKKLMELKPKEATVIIDGEEVTIPLEQLSVGQFIIVKPGEKIPTDGIITKGFSTVDESMITGESFPIEKKISSIVIGGTINKNGTFVFEITSLGDNSVLGQIIKMVEEAQGSKAPIQKLADKIAAVFVPTVIGIATLTFIGWMIFGSEHSFVVALVSFVAVLIIACPCALGLATPTAIMVGTGLGASKGILIKNGESLEIAHKVTTVVLDKTGTITDGNPTVTDVVTNEIDEIELLSLVSSVEKRSQHPIAEAIVNYAKNKNISSSEIESFNNISGFGVTAIINGKMILAGNEKLMNEYSININGFIDSYNRFTKEGKSIVFVAVDGKFKGLLAVEDPIKSTTSEAIKKFNELGLNVVMLTGDNERTAKAIAERIGIQNYFAEVLPNEKANKIKELQSKGNIVAMVGDGINDAPALVTADLGIAIGTGTDVAIESSDITLIKGDLLNVLSAIKLSKRTIKTIKQNLFWAFIYNIIGIPLAALGMLNPMIGALAMSFSSVSVISNSLRLKRYKL